MSHPSLGLPPLDVSAGYPAAADALRSAKSVVAARALEAVAAADPAFRDRYSELALRNLLADTQAMIDRVAVSVSANDPGAMSHWAEMAAVRFRKKRVPMDDVIALLIGIRDAAAAVVPPNALETVSAAVEDAVRILRWHRRLAGDARKRHPLLAFIYKGA